MNATQPLQSKLATSLASQVGVAIVNIQHQVVWCNARCAQLLGRTAAELRGKRLEYSCHPDDVRLDAEFARRLFAGEIDSYQVAKRFLRPDQSMLRILLTISLVRDGGGRPMLGHAMLEPDAHQSMAEPAVDPAISQIQARMFS